MRRSLGIAGALSKRLIPVAYGNGLLRSFDSVCGERKRMQSSGAINRSVFVSGDAGLMSAAPAKTASRTVHDAARGRWPKPGATHDLRAMRSTRARHVQHGKLAHVDEL